MTYTSFLFLVFLVAVTAAYFVCPLKYRWVVLLAGSIYFYYLSGPEYLPFIAADALISYGAARLIASHDRKTEKKKRLLILSVTLVLVIGFLCFTKFAKYFMPGKAIIVPLGISYYTFSTVGYLLDVYWSRYEPEKNILKYLLYLSFFPHILQGPIPRFNKLGPQLFEGHRFDYRRACFGAQLMLWGFFQKLVIADRLEMFVSSVYENPDGQYGFVLVLATFFYAIEIYTDFSGCVNMARGMSQILGIELEENFRQPYFSQSVEEFWRRWHMTLGGWFRDYLGMPVSISKPVKKWSKAARKKWGGAAGKRVVTVSALVMVWISTGLWHGTGWNYMIWAAWQGGIIILGVFLKDEFPKWNKKLHIKEDSRGFALFRIIRTFILVGMIPRVITHAPTLAAARTIFINTFKGTGIAQFKAGGLIQYGWSKANLAIAIGAILVQFAVSILKEKNISIRETIAARKLPIRWIIYLAALFAVIIFGIYGPGYNSVNFAYMDF